jgi:hypothetical protein
VYYRSAYFLAKITSKLPARAILSCLYMIISFRMTSIGTNILAFAINVGITLIFMVGDALELL